MQKIQKRASFRHLDQKHRDRIHALYLHGHTQKHIAEIVGVTPGTISRELHRYGKKTWRYSSLRAQKDAEENDPNEAVAQVLYEHLGFKIIDEEQKEGEMYKTLFRERRL